MANINIQLEKYNVWILATQLDKLGCYGDTRTTPTHTAHKSHTHTTNIRKCTADIKLKVDVKVICYFGP